MKREVRIRFCVLLVLLVFLLCGIDPVAAITGGWYIKGISYPMDVEGKAILLGNNESGLFGVNVESETGDFEGTAWIFIKQNYYRKGSRGMFVDTDDLFWYVRPTIVKLGFRNAFIDEWTFSNSEWTHFGSGGYGFVVFDNMGRVSVTNIPVKNGGCINIPNLPNEWDFTVSGTLGIPYTGNFACGASNGGDRIEYAIVNKTGWRILNSTGLWSAYWGERGLGRSAIGVGDLWGCYKSTAEGDVWVKCDGTETGTASIDSGILAIRIVHYEESFQGRGFGAYVHYLSFGVPPVKGYSGIIVTMPKEAYVGVRFSGAAYPSQTLEEEYTCHWNVPDWISVNGCSVSGVPTAPGVYAWGVSLSAPHYETKTASGWITVRSPDDVVNSGGVGIAGDIIRTLGLADSKLANFVGGLDSVRVSLINAMRDVAKVVGNLKIVDVALDVNKFVSFGMKFLPPHANIVLSIFPVVVGIKVVLWVVGAVKQVVKWW